MAHIMIFDVETSGTAFESDHIIEIAYSIMDVPTRTVIKSAACVVPFSGNSAYPINGIDPSLGSKVDSFLNAFILGLSIDLDIVKAIVAHKVSFDKSFMDKYVNESLPSEFQEDMRVYFEKPWICSLEDFRLPSSDGRGKKLAYHAVDAGIPFGVLHRAMADVTLLSQLLAKVEHLDAIVQRALLPQKKYLLTAEVNFDNNELAKKEDFKWNKDARAWRRVMKGPVGEIEAEIEELKKNVKFHIKVDPII